MAVSRLPPFDAEHEVFLTRFVKRLYAIIKFTKVACLFKCKMCALGIYSVSSLPTDIFSSPALPDETWFWALMGIKRGMTKYFVMWLNVI